MYIRLLCRRYLFTRYIALVCIVSVTLGVATMIVVNSVMEGFSHEMQSRLNGMLGDLVIRTRTIDGVADPLAHMEKIRRVAGADVVGMSPTVHTPALVYITVGGQSITQPVTLVGIDEATYDSVSKFGQYLQHPQNREQLSFNLRGGGYDVYDHQTPVAEQSHPRKELENAGWPYRRYKARLKAQQEHYAAHAAAAKTTTADPFQGIAPAGKDEGELFDPAVEQHNGIVLGIGVCSYRTSDAVDHFIALPGDDVRVSFTTASMPPKVLSESYTVVDIYESKMSEYDGNIVFVPITALQKSRGMIDPETGIGKFTAIQVKLREGADANAVRDKLANHFDSQLFTVATWRDEQGPLLSAVQMETLVLNVLLFMIIAVAGFGILAIFFMIVVEKTRDIGILKSLGASSDGIMMIFLGYGWILGTVGAGVGTAIGLLFVWKINEIADLLGRLTGRPVFDPAVYYFYKIPTIIDPFTVSWIVAGAIAIAVAASVLPAWRASRLHPVRALRFE